MKESMHYSQPKTSSILAKVHGRADLLFDGIIEFTHSTVKKQVAGNGTDIKTDVEVGVRQFFPDKVLEFRTNDESGAMAVALTYYILKG